MKKTIYIMAAALSAMSMAACSGNQKSAEVKDEPAPEKTEVYTGILPAADVDGIKYNLELAYNATNDYKDGSYKLDETYLEDRTKDEGKNFKSDGDFTVMDKDGKTYLKLVESPKDSVAAANTTPTYFLVESDSTIVMVNADLQVSETPGLNYTLKLAK